MKLLERLGIRSFSLNQIPGRPVGPHRLELGQVTCIQFAGKSTHTCLPAPARAWSICPCRSQRETSLHSPLRTRAKKCVPRLNEPSTIKSRKYDGQFKFLFTCKPETRLLWTKITLYPSCGQQQRRQGRRILCKCGR